MKRSLLLVVLVMAMVLAVAPAVSAQGAGAAHVERGFTLLELDAATAEALTNAGVRVSAVPPATSSTADPAFAFPVVGGALSTDPLAGRIRHSGGLKFAAGGKSLTVKNFVINLNRGVLTARVPGGPRVPLLKLQGGDANVFGGRIVTLGGVEARLTPTAATALNDTLGTDAFAGGILVGEASSIVVLAR